MYVYVQTHIIITKQESIELLQKLLKFAIVWYKFTLSGCQAKCTTHISCKTSKFLKQSLDSHYKVKTTDSHFYQINLITLICNAHAIKGYLTYETPGISLKTQIREYIGVQIP